MRTFPSGKRVGRPPMDPWTRVRKSDGCWQWTGGRTSWGYGQLKRDGRLWSAHRYFYTLLRGPIPEGLQIDHLCRNKLCVNPGHLEAVTCQVNISRTPRATKTHCIRGHFYTGKWSGHQRVCRPCHRFLYHRRMAVQRAAAYGASSPTRAGQ